MPGLPPEIQGDALAQLLLTKYGIPPEQVPAMQRAILNNQATNAEGLQTEAVTATADKEMERMAYLEMMGLLLSDKDNLDPAAKRETDAFLEHGRSVTKADAASSDAKERTADLTTTAKQGSAPPARTTTIAKPGASAVTVQSGPTTPAEEVHKARLQRALTARKAFLGY